MKQRKRGAKKIKELYEKVIELNPNSVEMLLEYAAFVESRKNFGDAVDLYIRALELPETPFHEKGKELLRALFTTHFPDDELPDVIKPPPEPEPVEPEQPENQEPEPAENANV